MPPYSWSTPGRKPGHVDEGDQRDVERVAGAHEAGRLLGGLDVEHAGEHHRLVADDADGVAVDAGEAAHDVPAQRGKYSKKSPSSTTAAMTFFMSYGLFGLAGMRSTSSGQQAARGRRR